ncbi:MAG: 50S ribosomal protein L18 [Candidatus Doudnabacteria bacterium]|nr:50S ribosomal protein L18 [Candidatus Doudnabacteria bacterium]
MDKNKKKVIKRQIRHNRVRSKVFGTLDRPRLSVFRSLSGIYAQLIDDSSGKTLAQASFKEVKSKAKKIDVSKEVGKILAEKAIASKITSCVFDRGGFAYHGRVKALAEGAREAGLKF